MNVMNAALFASWKSLLSCLDEIEEIRKLLHTRAAWLKVLVIMARSHGEEATKKPLASLSNSLQEAIKNLSDKELNGTSWCAKLPGVQADENHNASWNFSSSGGQLLKRKREDPRKRSYLHVNGDRI